ncbi:MAG: O-antigen ligase family protein [Parcubacteria group bacterium]|jgi:O-antigen ligase
MIFNFFIFLCFYLPFQIALNPAVGVDLASVRVLILILFFVWVYGKIRNKKRLFFLDTQAKLILFFLFLSVASLFFAQNYSWGARKLLYLFSIFPLYFVVKDILNSREKVIKTLKSLVLSGAVVSILGIIQFFAQFFWNYENISKLYSNYIGPIFWGENLARMVSDYPSWLVGVSGQNYFRAIGTFPDPHSFSLFLGMMLPLSVILFFISKKKIFWALSTAVIFLANILTFSRGGYVAIIVGIIIFVGVFWKKTQIKHKFMAGLAVMFLVLMLTVPGPVSQRFDSSFDLQEGSNAGRIDIWQKSLETIKTKPFLGTGIGNFSLEVDKELGYRNPIYAHNTYLDIAVEEGVLASLVWMLILFITLLDFWIFSKKDMISCGFFISLIIFSAHSMVETGIYSPMVLTLFLTIISLQYEKE